MSFFPGTVLGINGKPCTVTTVHTNSFYTVQRKGIRRMKLWQGGDGAWRYGAAGIVVDVTWCKCDGCGRPLLADEDTRCDDCRKVDDAIAEGAL